MDTSALVDGADGNHLSRVETLRYLRGTYPLDAPVLVESELGQVVHRKLNDAFGATLADRTESLNLHLFGIGRFPPNDASRAACGRLAEEFGLCYYDAEFLELAARDEVGFLLTQDRLLLDAARQHLGADRAADLDGAAEMIAAGQL